MRTRLCHHQSCNRSQLQRSCATKPRVARHELPWDVRIERLQPQRGCAIVDVIVPDATPLGLMSLMRLSQGSSCLATLGSIAESRWDSEAGFGGTKPKGHTLHPSAVPAILSGAGIPAKNDR